MRNHRAVVDGAATVLAQLTAPSLDWIAGVAHRLARWPNATVPWPATPTGAAVLAGLSVTMVILLRHRRFRELFAAAAAGVALIAVPTRIVAPGWPAQGWLLTACEVGQGDAMVLSTGEEGTAVVIDTGPDPGLVDACLDRLGIGTIAAVDSDPPACRPYRRADRGNARPHGRCDRGGARPGALDCLA